MFAKINEIDLLMLLFNEKAVITPGIRDEIVAPLAYGYTFPLALLAQENQLSFFTKILRNLLMKFFKDSRLSGNWRFNSISHEIGGFILKEQKESNSRNFLTRCS
jgi:hypothetical protein